jgi:hypothetical protein
MVGVLKLNLDQGLKRCQTPFDTTRRCSPVMMKLCEVELCQTLQVFVKLRMPSCPDLFRFEPLKVFQQLFVLP